MDLVLDFTLFAVIGGAAFFDIKERRIPNWIILFALTVGLLLGAFQSSTQFIFSVTGFVAGILALTIPFAFGWMGAGDVKLIAAIALWFGLGQELITFGILFSFYGGFLALAILSYRHMPLPAIVKGWNWATNLYNPTKGVPYGVAIAAAAITLRTAVL